MLKYAIYAVAALAVFYASKYIDLEIRQRRKKARFCSSSQELPLGLDFLADIKSLSRTFRNFEYFKQRFSKYGDTSGLWVLGIYIVVTKDPENIKALLATQFNDFGKGEQFGARWQEFLGAGIFNADGETWSHARAMMRPQFLKERVADLENFEDKMQHVFDLIRPGEIIDIMEIWFKFTLDSATEHLFGHCANSLTTTGKEDHAFASVFARVQELQTARESSGPLWKFFYNDNREMTRQLAHMNAFVDKYVQIALHTDISEKDESLLATLVRVNRDPVFLRDALVSALLAGRDTTAATLSWIIKELSKDSDLYKNLREEILAVIGPADLPTYGQLKNFKLLQAIINETLRLYPIVPFNSRASFHDTTLPRGGGPDGKSPIFIPARSKIIYSAMLLQRTLNIPRADEWVPRRWLDSPDGKYTPDHWTYIPFNGGPRICLGQNFALTEIAYAITRLVQRFDGLQNCDQPLIGDDRGFRFDIILTPRYGAYAKFTKSDETSS